MKDRTRLPIVATLIVLITSSSAGCGPEGRVGVEPFGARQEEPRVTTAKAVLGESSLIPANDLSATHGTFRSYYPDKTAQFGGSADDAQYQVITVPTRADAYASFDVLNYADATTVGGRECFDLKYVTLERLSDGARQGAQMWVLSGTKSGDGASTFPLQLTTAADGGQAAYVTFDLNANFQPDDGPANTFRVTVPGYGHPYAFHSTYDQRYVLQVWYRQYSTDAQTVVTRQAWSAAYDPPAPHTNPYWPDGGLSLMCLQKAEAWWYDDGAGHWDYGAGTTCTNALGDGLVWPCVGGFTYGSRDFHAKDTSAMWHVQFWYPRTWDYGPKNLW